MRVVMLAMAIAMISCAYGGGPAVAFGRHGMSIGAQGGAGPGGRKGAVRIEAGAGVAIAWRGGAAGGYGLLGSTLELNGIEHEERSGYGAAVTLAALRDEAGAHFVGGAGPTGWWYDEVHHEFASEGSNRGYSATIMVRSAGGRLDVMLWPQFVGYATGPHSH